MGSSEILVHFFFSQQLLRGYRAIQQSSLESVQEELRDFEKTHHAETLFFAKENWVCSGASFQKAPLFGPTGDVSGFCRFSWCQRLSRYDGGWVNVLGGWGKNTLLAPSRFDEKRYHSVIIS